MKKIVFITSTSENPLFIKRVNEFIEQGYEVEAYAFVRGGKTNREAKYQTHSLGELSNTTPYHKRIGKIFKGVRRVIRTYRRDDVLFYFMGLDVAMMFCLQCKRSYIFEECDMVHTYIRHSIVRNILERIDKYVIRKSLLTVFTSEGFAQYHFGNHLPQNVCFIPNRLATDVVNFPIKQKSESSCLRIGFVGGLRFESIARFAYYFVKNFPKNEFHFFGFLNASQRELFAPLEPYSNCHFHGAFKNPDDLPEIYSQIDLVLSTYDVKYDNVKYAEPNKLYEAVYFETPIIVSKGTFLADKTLKLGIGYEVDPLNENEVVEFVNGLTPESLENCRQHARALGKEWALNINTAFFEKLSLMIR